MLRFRSNAFCFCTCFSFTNHANWPPLPLQQAQKRRGPWFRGALPEIRSVCVKRHTVFDRADRSRRHCSPVRASKRRLVRSGRKALAAACATVREHFATADRCHARTEAVPALADQFRRLIGAFHSRFRRKGGPCLELFEWDPGLPAMRNNEAPPETCPSVARLSFKRPVKSMPVATRRRAKTHHATVSARHRVITPSGINGL